ncbi:YdcF family protein [Aquibacillus sediminis]|uniref:YdcF family protein n=1 Tax=Aquibacillus sediminis TaxID=2574734 RepID=UPI001107C252|nr:YdcF family protein [Aquibacillus sediminis]
MKILKKGILLFISVMLAWFVIHSVVIMIDGWKDDQTTSDVGVVLGNKVNQNGEPSDRLKARLDKAVELYDRGNIRHIIVSGGTGKEGFDEAKVMNNYLINQGIAREDITTDSNGYNTEMTAENAKQIIDRLEMETVTVITQYYHVTRTKLAFKQAGFSHVGGTHAEILEWRDPYSIFREFFAFYKYLLF